MTTVSKALAPTNNNNRLQLSLPVMDKVLHMYFEYHSLLNDGDKETMDFRAKIVRRLLSRDPNAMCESYYLCVVKDMMDEYEKGVTMDNFNFCDWLNRYVMALPDDPLEALSYDQFVMRIFSRELTPH